MSTVSSEPLILILTGTNAAGKETVVEFLKEHGFKHFSVSDEIKKEVLKKGVEPTRENLTIVANEFRMKFKNPAYWVVKLCEEALQRGGNTVIESIRNPHEINAVKSVLKNFRFQLIAVDAHIEIRYHRSRRRGNSKDRLSFDEFEAAEKREMESTDPYGQNIRPCIDMAKICIENNGTPQQLKLRVDGLIAELGG